ncbi:hypothetical protein JQC70_07785 [Burkholderia contaminans]|nr:hypothetical protein [Burkholderia contaminans]MBH9671819.1 hypothetical protein [Burkholderia contaminans]MBH9679237.1 hypothetical protein [Burkholderia contaminans]MBH9709228.1 hypothetical protein [Burkholderia contaminans]MBM6425051.1 hypothetical protein [Burkholderia contaminans]
MRVATAFVAIWLLAAAYWKATAHVPSAKELFMAGVGIPLLLVIGVASIRKGFAPVPGPAPKPGPQAGGALAETSGEDPSLRWTLALLDASVRLPAGSHVADVLALARDGRVVGLHPTLQRLDGTKVFAGTAASIWRDDPDDGMLALDVMPSESDEQRRAMLLAAEAIDELMARHATTPVTATGDTSRGAAPPFALHLLLPERWRADAPTLAAWLDRHLERGHWRPSVEPAQVAFVAHPVDALAALDALNVELHRTHATTRHLVLACDSTLSQPTVNELDHAGRLFAHNRPDGQVLGEGACALLLALPPVAGMPDRPRIHRLVTAEHRPSNGQAHGETVAGLLRQAVARMTDADPAMAGCALVSDADQRSSRRTEIGDAAARTWPDDSDVRLRCSHLGIANGESGGALALGLIAAAGTHAAEAQRPTLVASISDPLLRGALAVSHHMAPDADGASPPA